MNLYGDKDIESCDEISKRRLFFDWFVHDHIIPDKRDTGIVYFLGNMKIGSLMNWKEIQRQHGPILYFDSLKF